MVVADKVVVDRLGDMDAAQGITALARLFGDDADGVGRIIAADIEKMPDRMRLQDF
jgi:hypothetical protein